MSKILCVSAAILIGLASLPLNAQERTILNLRRGEDAVLWQARSCVGEVGWNSPDDACSAMTWIHAKRAKRTGVTLSTMIRTYSAAVREPGRRMARRAMPSPVSGDTILASVATASTPRRRTYDASARRRWVRDLSLSGPAPEGWPEHMRRAWPRYQSRFREIHSLVDRVIGGLIEDPCPNAQFYGGPMDSAPRRHEPDPSCTFEGTAQLFYRQEESGID
jgi:hypothetical protein